MTKNIQDAAYQKGFNECKEKTMELLTKMIPEYGSQEWEEYRNKDKYLLEAKQKILALKPDGNDPN